nr:NADH dehydrogenase subunit 6 [Zaraea sp. CSCS-Hym-MC0131]
MMKFILIMMIMNSLMLLLCKTPLPMGLILLLQTLLIAVYSGISSYTFFFSYILFMILLGGMLVLFIYISSLTPNMKFKFNKSILIFSLLILIILMILMSYYNFNNNINVMDINLPQENNHLLKMSLKKMFDCPDNKIMFILINYLLMTLFISVKIINIKKGPLRKM